MQTSRAQWACFAEARTEGKDTPVEQFESIGILGDMLGLTSSGCRSSSPRTGHVRRLLFVHLEVYSSLLVGTWHVRCAILFMKPSRPFHQDCGQQCSSCLESSHGNTCRDRLELGESLDRFASSGQNSENIESDLACVRQYPSSASSVTYSLAERSALADRDNVTLLNTESWRDVGSQIAVPLLVSGVFGYEVEVFASDDNGSVHLGRDDLAGQDSSSNGDHAGEGAFLVCTSHISFLLLLCFAPPRIARPAPASRSTYRCKNPQWPSLAF